MLRVYVNQEEKKLIEELARKEGMSTSSFVKNCIKNSLKKEQADEAERRLPDLLDRFISLLDALHTRLDQIEKKVELVGEEIFVTQRLSLTRILHFTKLTEEQYESFKNGWSEFEHESRQKFQEKLQKIFNNKEV